MPPRPCTVVAEGPRTACTSVHTMVPDPHTGTAVVYAKGASTVESTDGRNQCNAPMVRTPAH
eukprot:2093665-Karenia_brevis.AAC.1